MEKLCKVLHTAANTHGKPTAIVAKTFKGKGIVGVEDQENWHGKPLGDKADKAIEVITSLIKNTGPHKLVPQSPVKDAPVLKVDFSKVSLSEPPAYKLGEKVKCLNQILLLFFYCW